MAEWKREGLPVTIITEKLKLALPYAGIPVVIATLLIIQAGRTVVFSLLLNELILTFGYIAAIVDLKTKRVPNSLILAMFAAWVIVMTPTLFLDTGTAVDLLRESAFGAAIGGGLFLFAYLISRKGLGGGDVKFMACVGLYQGLAGVTIIMLCGTTLAALTGLILIMLKKIGRKDTIPLAPFLFAGILIAVFFR